MYTDILILSRLTAGPAHGYEIKKYVERIVGPKAINNNVLYPALRRFEGDGLIERVSHESQGNRPPRRVYRITDVGLGLFAAQLRDTDPDVLVNPAEFQIRIGFFKDLEPDDQRAIIAARRGLLAREIASQQGLRPEAAAVAPWGAEVIDFNIRQMRAELEWLDRLDRLTGGLTGWAGSGESAGPGGGGRVDFAVESLRSGSAVTGLHLTATLLAVVVAAAAAGIPGGFALAQNRAAEPAAEIS